VVDSQGDLVICPNGKPLRISVFAAPRPH
jgi:hypothetical protein